RAMASAPCRSTSRNRSTRSGVAESWVVSASPLIVLAKIRRGRRNLNPLRRCHAARVSPTPAPSLRATPDTPAPPPPARDPLVPAHPTPFRMRHPRDGPRDEPPRRCFLLPLLSELASRIHITS